MNFKLRYWIVQVSTYYPCGFLNDVELTTDSLKEVMKAYNKLEAYEYHSIGIWDSKESKWLDLDDEAENLDFKIKEGN